MGRLKVKPTVTYSSHVESPAVDLASLTLEGLTAFFTSIGEKPFRAKQLYTWVHQRGATSFDEMTDLSKALRETLKAKAVLRVVTKDLEQRSVDGTIKYRWLTHDGKLIESVYMPSPERKTLCVSTQVGCAMGCRFCATATLGLVRHLSPSEIVAQVHAVNREVRKNEGLETLRRRTSVGCRGRGGPRHSCENVRAALELLQSEAGPNFSARHITVSTVGLVPVIERFATETDVKLAISLNASSDEVRDRIMPVNKRWKIADLMEAVKKFPVKQGRRVTFEYVLMNGVNDTDEDAHRLAKLLEGVPSRFWRL